MNDHNTLRNEELRARFCELLFAAVDRDPARYLTWLELLIESRLSSDVMRASLDGARRNTDALRGRVQADETETERRERLQRERIAATSPQVQP